MTLQESNNLQGRVIRASRVNALDWIKRHARTFAELREDPFFAFVARFAPAIAHKVLEVEAHHRGKLD